MKNSLFALTIAARRTSLGLTRKQLAQRVGVHQAQVQRWEDGVYCPSTAVLPRLAEALEVEVSHLVISALAGSL